MEEKVRNEGVLAPPPIVRDDKSGIGRFNGELEKYSSQLLSSGTYKRNRVILMVPAIAPIPPRVYLSHCSLIFPPNQGCHRMLCEGDEVGRAYSNAIDAILAHPDLSTWEWIVTLETDNLPPNDGIVRLIQKMHEHPEFDAISGLYFCKGESGWQAPHIWGDISDPIPNYRPQPPVPGKLLECHGLSMGFCIYRLQSLFKDSRIERPWFETKASKDGAATQDLSFWGKARKFGHRCAVDCGCPVGHFDSGTGIVW